MNNIENKAIRHCQKLLKTTDSYNIFSVMLKALQSADIPQEKHKTITDPIMDAVRAEYTVPCIEVLDWFDELLKPDK